MTEDSLRLLVAEDDPVQRAALVQWMAELRPNWKVVAATSTVDDTLAAFDEHAPDLSLIDIHLQGSQPAAWVRSLEPGLPLIFVTGDPQYAVHAFDNAAIDYLLKPVTMRRLKVALDKAVDDPRLRRRMGSAQGNSGERVDQWITISRHNEVLIVSPAEIIYLEAALKYTRVVTERGEGLVRTGINDMCARLADHRFVKVHRSLAVNLRFISSVKRDEMGHTSVHLIGRKEVLRVSKSFQNVFKAD